MSTTQFIEAGLGQDLLDKREIRTFISGAAILALDWVQLDTLKTDSDRVLYAIQADTSIATGNPLVVGVALDAATAAGQKVRVVVRGYVEGANVATAVGTAGTALVVDNTFVGRAVAIAAADTCAPCGFTLEAAVSNKADVFVTCR
tara:strand:- start:4357 stop:4794 length:438 start_codon:yes stop_codon:yes gene_type:complete